MSEERDTAGFGQRWGGWAGIIGAVFGLLTLLGVGTFLYNEVWQSKVLTYTILPTYDLGTQAFTGLVIENRGRVPLTEVNIILSDLEAPIQALYMPSAHEPVQMVSGGVGEKEVFLEMRRLSTGASLSIYLLTSAPIALEEKQTFLVSSSETAGVSSGSEGNVTVFMLGALISAVAFGSALFAVFLSSRRDLEAALIREANLRRVEKRRHVEELRHEREVELRREAEQHGEI